MALHRIKQIRILSKYGVGKKKLKSSLGKKVIWLNVSGIYLPEKGFNAGDNLSITIQEGMLIVELFSEKESEQETLKSL